MNTRSTKERDVTEIGHTVLGTVLRDEPWQDLGFGRRPRRSAFFQRFRPKWKVDLEKAALKEMVILLTTAHLAAQVIAEQDIDGVIAFYVDGTERAQELWRTLGYTSRSEAQLHLRKSIAAYSASAAAPEGWSQLLLSRLGVPDIPQPKLAAHLVVGTVRFSETVRSMLAVLRQQNGPSGSSQ
jgi:hypothetical protein